MNSSLKRHGGKHYLAPWILEHRPTGTTHYAEAYFGAGSVLFQKPLGESEAVNDLDGNLTNFWRTLQDPNAFDLLQKRAQATPVSTAAWDDARAILAAPASPEQPDAARAWAYLVLVRQSRQGLMESFNNLSKARTRRGVNEQAAAWLSSIEGLPEAHERLKGVVVYNEKALKFIRQQDSPHTWHYLDPPYLQETRTAKSAYGEFEMTPEDHFALLELLSDIKGKFSLSGYHSDMYDEAAKVMGWRCVEKRIANHSSGSKEKPTMTECLWMNY